MIHFRTTRLARLTLPSSRFEPAARNLRKRRRQVQERGRGAVIEPELLYFLLTQQHASTEPKCVRHFTDFPSRFSGCVDSKRIVNSLLHVPYTVNKILYCIQIKFLSKISISERPDPKGFSTFS